MRAEAWTSSPEPARRRIHGSPNLSRAPVASLRDRLHRPRVPQMITGSSRLQWPADRQVGCWHSSRITQPGAGAPTRACGVRLRSLAAPGGACRSLNKALCNYVAVRFERARTSAQWLVRPRWQHDRGRRSVVGSLGCRLCRCQLSSLAPFLGSAVVRRGWSYRGWDLGRGHGDVRLADPAAMALPPQDRTAFESRGRRPSLSRLGLCSLGCRAADRSNEQDGCTSDPARRI